MIVESLELKNFRNYERISLFFDPGTNIIYGDNAQGKTNILESIYLCGTAKSHKGSRDSDMVRFGEEEAHVRMIVRKDQIPHRIDIHLKKNKVKGAAVDGIPIHKAGELLGMIHLVLFSPEDLNIIKNGPAERRRFMDSEICQLHSLYYSQLSAYNKILLQRNKLLKDIPYIPSLKPTLDSWDEQLVSYGKKIIDYRGQFIEELNGIVREIHRNLTGDREEIDLTYEPNAEKDIFKEKLKQMRETDLKFKTSSVGPHRDDFRVKVNGIDLRHFGSQGQQRSAALSLKLSEIDLVQQNIHDMPVLLLDDVLSELDSSRQKMLLNTIRRGQTFITCTGMDELIENKYPMNKIFHIVNGTLQQV